MAENHPSRVVGVGGKWDRGAPGQTVQGSGEASAGGDGERGSGAPSVLVPMSAARAGVTALGGTGKHKAKTGVGGRGSLLPASGSRRSGPGPLI